MTNHTRPENDINQMNMHQVVLLCFLVSAMTAVVSAITVVQLLSQEPTTVVQTIDRVTEKVIQQAPSDNGKPSQTIVERTIIIKESDLVAQSVAAFEDAAVPITAVTQGQTSSLPVGYGYVLAGGYLLTSIDIQSSKNYFAAQAKLGSAKTRQAISLLPIDNTQATVSFINQPPTRGQTVVFLSAEGNVERGTVNTVTDQTITISTNLSAYHSGLVLDLSERAIGYYDGTTIHTSAALQSIIADLKTQEPTGTTPEPTATTTPVSDPATACSEVGGSYSAEYAECLGVSENTCQDLGGSFNACASACRHDSEAEVCDLQCVEVCTLS